MQTAQNKFNIGNQSRNKFIQSKMYSIVKPNSDIYLKFNNKEYILTSFVIDLPCFVQNTIL